MALIPIDQVGQIGIVKDIKFITENGLDGEGNVSIFSLIFKT
jgi:hypothetical protein